ncbi:MAG TPA: SGNH/GDSL hydrolase family protein [Candidatus Bathyarchaeia archaeon]|nr:SGNH/GDSL hydrolase family protein [Candidatus Bathyarchaeia archaeon]
MFRLLFILLLVSQTLDPKAEWEKRLDPDTKGEPAYAFVGENPALPRVLLIGDSISVGYTPGVRKLLEGKANVLRIPVNGGPTSRGVKFLGDWLGAGKWDVIHFNWGLHDIKRMKGGKMDITAEWQVGREQYEKNLDALAQKLKSTGAKLIWASTTPVPEGAGGRIKGDEVIVNRIAEKVMKKHGVEINDLYACVLPHLEKYQRPRNVHFTDEGSAFLAQRVAAEIERALAK